jgi:hypothetical protein
VWNAVKILEIFAALSGAAGTGFLYFGTFGFESFPYYSNHELVRAVSARNKRRLLMQRIGLGLLMPSFLCGVAHVFVE